MVRPRGRQLNQWKNKNEEDLNDIYLRETEAMERDGLRAAISRQTHLHGDEDVKWINLSK